MVGGGCGPPRAGRAVPMPAPLVAALDAVAAQDREPAPEHAGAGIRGVGA
jgi:carnitine 3-dehydrogenase